MGRYIYPQIVISVKIKISVLVFYKAAIIIIISVNINCSRHDMADKMLQKFFVYSLDFHPFDFERIWWRLFQKRIVPKFYIYYVFISLYNHICINVRLAYNNLLKTQNAGVSTATIKGGDNMRRLDCCIKSSFMACSVHVVLTKHEETLLSNGMHLQPLWSISNLAIH